MVKIFDSHCHLLMLTNQDDVITATKANDISMLNISTQIEDLLFLQQLYKQHGIRYSIGIHPLYLKTDSISQLDKYLSENAKYAAAIGETGIDTYRTCDPDMIALQKRSFEIHCHYAERYNKPIVLHLRNSKNSTDVSDAESIAWKILQKYDVRGVIHCCTASEEFIDRMLCRGWLISFSGIITFAKTVQKLINCVPLHKILIETDSPYLIPKQIKGKVEHNSPLYVKYVAEIVAHHKNITYESICKITYDNAMKLFDYDHNVSYN